MQRALQAAGMVMLDLHSILLSIAVALSPGILSVCGHLSILMIVVALHACGFSIDPTDSTVLTAIYVNYGLLFGSWVVHLILARSSVLPSIIMWSIRIVINALTMLVLGGSFIFLLVVSLSTWGSSAVQKQITPQSVAAFFIAVCAVILFVASPVIVSLMISEDLFYGILRHLPPYYLVLPTLESDMQTLALARLDDWTW